MSTRLAFIRICLLLSLGLVPLTSVPLSRSVRADANSAFLQPTPKATATKPPIESAAPTRTGSVVATPEGPLIFDFPTPSSIRDEGPIAGQELSVVEKSALAVVKLNGCSEVGAENCTYSEGSGTIVHPTGLILTALHVVIEDPENLRSPLLPEISVGVVEELSEPVEARYRAGVIAFDSELDLALLAIYRDEEAGGYFLPTLPVENIATREFLTGALRVMGFQQGQRRLKQPSVDYYGTNEDGAVEVDGPLVQRGFSGAPLLVEREGRYHIGGVVFYRTDGPVLVQPVNQLGDFRWRDSSRRLWAEDVQAESAGAGALSRLNLTANIHTVDLSGRDLATGGGGG